MQDKVNKIYNGNNIDVLKNFEDNSCDTLISDFPYALSFMNAKWDTMPRLEMLKEFYRVLKAGAFLVTTFTPRLDLQSELCMLLKEAGFDVSFSPLYFCYKSGFPKASNYAKVIRKQGYDNEAQYCDGLYSLSVKPAVEPIIIAQKPHGKAKYKQALDWYYERKELLDKEIKEEDLSLYTKNSSGGCYVDNGRIPTSQRENLERNNNYTGIFSNIEKKHTTGNNAKGRFPANLLCGFPISKEELRSEYPEATEEELEKMVSMIENPLDVGRVSKGGGAINNCDKTIFNNYTGKISNPAQDAGDLSRYFSLTAWSKKHFPNLHNIAEKTLQLQEDVKKTGDCLFVCKPAQTEKNAGLDLNGREKNKRPTGVLYNQEQQAFEVKTGNTHPTTKPIALYNYLITLFSKEGDIILDPFCGSGVTPIACVLTNRKYIGIEMSEEYHKIAEARVEYWKQQKEGAKIPYASKKNVSASTNINTKQEKLI